AQCDPPGLSPEMPLSMVRPSEVSPPPLPGPAARASADADPPVTSWRKGGAPGIPSEASVGPRRRKTLRGAAPAGFKSWERQFFVLDGRGVLAYHSGKMDPVQMLGAAGEECEPDPMDHLDNGLLLPIAQDIAGSAAGMEESKLSKKPTKKRPPVGYGRVDLLVSAVKTDADPEDSQVADLQFCFRIINPRGTLLLQAESMDERNGWVGDLQGVIAELLSVAATSGGRPIQSSASITLPKDGTVAGAREREHAASDPGAARAVLEALEGNDRCADCGAAAPDWASINLGLLLCQHCAGAHRGLGTHISKVRSLVLDTDAWTPAVIGLFKASSNLSGNAVWLGGAESLEAATREVLQGSAVAGCSELDPARGEATCFVVAGPRPPVVPPPPPTTAPPEEEEEEEEEEAAVEAEVRTGATTVNPLLKRKQKGGRGKKKKNAAKTASAGTPHPLFPVTLPCATQLGPARRRVEDRKA
ncbi:hypothetical protein CYMTET_31392, partial [Cymbomonas tetramitiformis]